MGGCVGAGDAGAVDFSGMTIEEIQEAIRDSRYYVAEHAFEEADEDRLNIDEVLGTILHAEIIEEYPDRKPHPRCLVLGWTQRGAPVHTVWEDDRRNALVALVTVYRPNPAEWIEWRRRR